MSNNKISDIEKEADLMAGMKLYQKRLKLSQDQKELLFGLIFNWYLKWQYHITDENHQLFIAVNELQTLIEETKDDH